jgi:hypothetical protein
MAIVVRMPIEPIDETKGRVAFIQLIAAVRMMSRVV